MRKSFSLHRSFILCFLFSVSSLLFLGSGCTQTNWNWKELLAQNQVKAKATEDEGFRFESEHFTLDFDKDLQKTQRFSSVKDRKLRGGEYLQGLEKQYQFTKNSFGIDTVEKIQVHVVTKVSTKGHNYAYARIGPNGIEAVFPIDAFYERGARAHEISHCFTMPLGLPAWLEEGIATMVQLEYEPSGRYSTWRKQRSLNAERFVDDKGINSIQYWRGHSGGIQAKGGRILSEEEAYIFCYALMLELKEKNGEDFFKKFFALLLQNRAYRADTNSVVYFMSQAAGKDLVPFFKNLKFDVANMGSGE